VNVPTASISLVLPSGWTVVNSGGDPALTAGDAGAGKTLLVGLKAPGTQSFPDDPSLQDTTVDGRPAKVGIQTDSGTSTTIFYVLTKAGGVEILCGGVPDARQDPEFRAIINSVRIDPVAQRSVQVKAAGLTITVPVSWTSPSKSDVDATFKRVEAGLGVPKAFIIGEVGGSAKKILLVGVKNKTARRLPRDPGLQDATIAGRPARVSVKAAPSGATFTVFYVLSRRGELELVFFAPSDARQDPSLLSVLDSVQLQ
jgi:hypothetical protein